jgi:dUTP pyrophosphatase
MMKFIKTDLAKQLETTLHTWVTEGTSLKYGNLPNTLDFTPVRGTEGSSGYDLKACIEAPVTIFPDQVVKIPTGIKIWNGSDIIAQDVKETSVYMYKLAGFILPRSSTKGAILNNTIGLCDEDYQHEIFVKLRNITKEAITITTGERFAQLVFMLTYIPSELEEVSEFDRTTTRTGGFGSTNKPEEQDLLGR